MDLNPQGLIPDIAYSLGFTMGSVGYSSSILDRQNRAAVFSHLSV
jgi:hypothetical protein